jgi:hypothetical protein
MPIASMSRIASFPEIGQLRKGGPKERRTKNGKEYEVYGKDLDHFRFTSDDESAVEAFHRAFGEEPREIGFFLPFPTLHENFECWKEAYTAGAIQHRCDGEICVGHRTKDGKWSTEPVLCPGECKATARLKIFIPAFRRLVFVTVLTNSIYDMVSIDSTLKGLQAVNGSLQNIPLILRRVEREISTPVTDSAGNPTGKRARRKKWLLQIEAEPQWAAKQFGAMREAAMLTSSHQPLLLEAGEIEEDGDDEDQPLDYTGSGVPTGASPGVGRVAIEYASAETISAIRNLWPKFGLRKAGQLVPFETIIRQNKWTLDTWPADRAAKTLEDLQRRALAAAEAEAEKKAAAAALSTSPTTDTTAEVHEAEVI